MRDTRTAFPPPVLTTYADIEDEIEKLESDANGDKARVNELKAELEKINKKKEEWVAEHPEHKKLVFRQRKPQGTKDEQAIPQPQNRNLFNKHGLPRHPERSIYYDPVMNPYGVPPPGMPYIERRKCDLLEPGNVFTVL